MPARYIKSLKPKRGYGHREHRSKRGRRSRLKTEIDWKLQKRFKEEDRKREWMDEQISKEFNRFNKKI